MNGTFLNGKKLRERRAHADQGRRRSRSAGLSLNFKTPPLSAVSPLTSPASPSWARIPAFIVLRRKATAQAEPRLIEMSEQDTSAAAMARCQNSARGTQGFTGSAPVATIAFAVLGLAGVAAHGGEASRPESPAWSYVVMVDETHSAGPVLQVALYKIVATESAERRGPGSQATSAITSIRRWRSGGAPP